LTAAEKQKHDGAWISEGKRKCLRIREREREVPGEACAAVGLDRPIDHLDRHLRRGDLRETPDARGVSARRRRGLHSIGR
jgi:hypothetical protein